MRQSISMAAVSRIPREGQGVVHQSAGSADETVTEVLGFCGLAGGRRPRLLIWGLFNIAAGYVLVCCVGRFDLRRTLHVAVRGTGILIMSLMLAHAFGRFYGGL
jgi:hypothetical protein